MVQPTRQGERANGMLPTLRRSFQLSKFLNMLLLTTALAMPLALSAQDHHDVAVKVYTDDRHHDSHQWNSDEDTKYRSYLQEHHKKYRDFDKVSHRDQQSYWDYRHQH